MKTISKFKVGDKVKVLPSATVVGVDEREVGKVVEIKSIGSDGLMISNSRGGRYMRWSVYESDVAPVIKVGQQLLFNFMG